MSFIITADSAANLPKKYAKENGIAVISLSLHTTDGTPFCDFDEQNNYKGFYQKMRGGLKMKTSQINPQNYCEFFEPFLERGDDVLYIAMSSGISGSFASANIAADMLKEKYPNRRIVIIDSLGASLGIYLLVFRAVELNRQGTDVDTTADILNALVPRILQIFTVGDLMHLKKGGRISTPAAIFGTALSIKPLLKGDKDGKIVICGKVRGRGNILKALKSRFDSDYNRESRLPVCISHCDCENDAVTLQNMLREIAPNAEFLTLVHEPTTAVHLGPDSLALYFEGENGVRLK